MDIDKYAQIINLPHHQSQTRPHMSMSDRAAQFAPFAALTGHEDAILETQRLTEEWIPPAEEEARRLNEQTALLAQRIAAGEQPEVQITHFVPDERKSGGSYETAEGRLRRIDETAGLFLMADGSVIGMSYITAIRIPGRSALSAAGR